MMITSDLDDFLQITRANGGIAKSENITACNKSMAVVLVYYVLVWVILEMFSEMV